MTAKSRNRSCHISHFFCNGNKRSPLGPSRLPIRAKGSRRPSGRSAIHAGTRDLCQRVGLDEVDISSRLQGTLLLPPSPAIAFPTLPYEHTLLTVCAKRSSLSGRNCGTAKAHHPPSSSIDHLLPCVYRYFGGAKSARGVLVQRAHSRQILVKFSLRLRRAEGFFLYPPAAGLWARKKLSPRSA